MLSGSYHGSVHALPPSCCWTLTGCVLPSRRAVRPPRCRRASRVTTRASLAEEVTSARCGAATRLCPTLNALARQRFTHLHSLTSLRFWTGRSLGQAPDSSSVSCYLRGTAHNQRARLSNLVCCRPQGGAHARAGGPHRRTLLGLAAGALWHARRRAAGRAGAGAAGRARAGAACAARRGHRACRLERRRPRGAHSGRPAGMQCRKGKKGIIACMETVCRRGKGRLSAGRLNSSRMRSCSARHASASPLAAVASKV